MSILKYTGPAQHHLYQRLADFECAVTTFLSTTLKTVSIYSLAVVGLLCLLAANKHEDYTPPVEWLLSQ